MIIFDENNRKVTMNLHVDNEQVIPKSCWNKFPSKMLVKYSLRQSESRGTLDGGQAAIQSGTLKRIVHP